MTNSRWFKVCSVADLKPGRAKSVRLFGRPFAVFNIDGSLYGMDGACAHMKSNLAVGHLHGHVIECAMHQWRYDVRTGKCLTEPDRDLKTMPVKIEDDSIWIEIELPTF